MRRIENLNADEYLSGAEPKGDIFIQPLRAALLPALIETDVERVCLGIIAEFHSHNLTAAYSLLYTDSVLFFRAAVDGVSPCRNSTASASAIPCCTRVSTSKTASASRMPFRSVWIEGLEGTKRAQQS